jgi:hypothetical protein
MEADPELAERIHTIRRTSGAKWRRDPANLEAVRRYHAAYYAEHRAEIQAARRKILDSMTPEQLNRWRARMRIYQRLYARRYREQLRENPHRHRDYLDRMREYRRRIREK